MSDHARLSMPVGEAMFTQRSIRKFKPDPIAIEDIHLIIDAAVKAPNGGNRQVGRFLAKETPEVTVACAGDYFILARERVKLAVSRHGVEPVGIVIPPKAHGVGVSTTLGRAKGGGPDGLAVVARSCAAADAAAAGVQAILPKQDGLRLALRYLHEVPAVVGGVIVTGDRIGVSGSVEIAA